MLFYKFFDARYPLVSDFRGFFCQDFIAVGSISIVSINPTRPIEPIRTFDLIGFNRTQSNSIMWWGSIGLGNRTQSNSHENISQGRHLSFAFQTLPRVPKEKRACLCLLFHCPSRSEATVKQQEAMCIHGGSRTSFWNTSFNVQLQQMVP